MPVNPDDIDLIAARQVEVYKEAEVQILGIVRDHLARGVDSPTWANERLTALGSLRRATLRVLAKLRADRSGSFRAAVSEAYRNGRGSMLTDLPGATGQAAREAVKTVPRLDAIESLSAALIRDVGQREHNVLRNVEDVYRQVQAAAVARSIAGGITRREASQAAWQGFVDQGVTSFTDRAGRTWRLTTYVEMAVRTVSMRAAVQGQLDRLEELGVPLVIVSNESGECPRCRPFEGKVLARTGPFGLIEAKSVTTGQMITVDVMTTLDMARLAGLLHPNCRHTIRAYLPGATKLPAGPTEQPEQHKAREQQRAIERKIRGSKEQAVAALTPEAKAKAEAKVRAYQAQMRQHIKDNPSLKRLPYREEIGAGNLPPGGKAPSPAGRLPGPPPPPKTTKRPETGVASFDRQLSRAATENDAWEATPRFLGDAFRPLARRSGVDDWPESDRRTAFEAVQGYKVNEYRGVNDRLRGLEPRDMSSAEADRAITAMDDAFRHSQLQQDVVVWRGVGTGRDVFGDAVDGDLTGVEWTDAAYMSTSALHDSAEHYARPRTRGGPPGVLLRIVVPPKVGAIGNEEVSDYRTLASASEAEVLLQRGLKLRVVRDHGLVAAADEAYAGPRSVRMLDVEVVPVTAKGAAVKKVPAKKAPARKTAPPPPTRTPKTNEALLKANQERQAAIDKARVAGHIAADFAELEYNSGNPDVLRERLDTLAQKARDDVSHGAPLPDGLDNLEQAAATGDAAKMRRAVAAFTRANGITMVGKPGGRDKYDPSRHEAQGVRPTAGAAVEVMRPGVSTRHNGEGIQVTKSLVADVSDDDAPAKVVKKVPARKAAVRKTAPPPPTKAEKAAAPAKAPKAAKKTAVRKTAPPPPSKKAATPAKTPAVVAAELHATQLSERLPGVRVKDELVRQAGLTPRSMQQLDAVHLPEPGSFDAEAYLAMDHGSAFAYYTQLGSNPSVFGTAAAATDNSAPAIWLSPHWHGGTMGGRVQKSVESGWFGPSGASTPIARITAHEYGHHVVDVLFEPVNFNGTADMPGEIALRFLTTLNDQLGANRHSSSARNGDLLEPVHWGFESDPHFSASGDLLDTWVFQNKDLIVEKVSGYAVKNFQELMAEIWQEYSTMGTAARPHIRVIGDLMRQLAEELRA